jgi:hypothetical protein
MEKFVGEIVQASDINKGEMVWHKGAYRLVTEIEVTTVDRIVLHLLDMEPLYLVEDDQMIRGWWYLVGRRIRR